MPIPVNEQGSMGGPHRLDVRANALYFEMVAARAHLGPRIKGNPSKMVRFWVALSPSGEVIRTFYQYKHALEFKAVMPFPVKIVSNRALQ